MNLDSECAIAYDKLQKAFRAKRVKMQEEYETRFERLRVMRTEAMAAVGPDELAVYERLTKELESL